MRILVTGGTGFTGTALVKRLLREGHSVVALDYKPGLEADHLKQMGAEIVLGSVTDRSTVDRAMAGVEQVLHLAAAFRELNVPQRFYDDVNFHGTRNVLESALQAGARRFVYCSTCGVHGNIDHPPADETAPIQPADYYQRTKYQAEPLVKEYAERGLPSVILRPAAIYGPGDPERFFLIFQKAAKGWFPMVGSGETLYHPLYIDNLVDAFVLAMHHGRTDGREYLIADQNYYSIVDIVHAVGRALDVDVKIRRVPLWPVLLAGHICEKVCTPLGITPPIFPRRVDWYRQNRAFDISRAKRELGYAPKVHLDEGLRRTAAWYRENGYLPAVPQARVVERHAHAAVS